MTDSPIQDQDDLVDQIPEEIITSTEPLENEEVAHLRDLLARQTADYQNLLRRWEKEKREMSTFFTEGFAKKILPTLDNLDRVVLGTPENLRAGAVYEWVKNAAMGLSKMLESIGVVAFDALGKELDPHYHEALTQAPGPEWMIVQEFEKGYMYGETVIRHAKVIVGNGSAL